ncbi:unnamed protein product [Porites lobata]|uniref:guanylate cyclase n=1 Tax=Porites lobata TaxID=104759 RepID=A0ABN8Q8X1_9CNID|nr:unnamed protein product [Porites lobata]
MDFHQWRNILLIVFALDVCMYILLPSQTSAHSHDSNSGSNDNEHEVKIGVLLPMTGYWPIGKTSASAITIAVDRINRNPNLLPGYNMTFLWNDSMCLAAEGLNQAVEFKISGVDAIIGDGCDIICEPAAILAASWNLPMVSWGCESSKLSEKTIYPSFARTVGSFSKMGDLFLSVFQYFHWNSIGILASTESIWQLAMTGLMKVFLQNDIDIRYLRTLSPGHVLVTEREEYNSILSRAKETARIFVILCYGGDMRALMLQALDFGMLNGDYAFLTVNLLPSAAIGNNTFMGNDGRDAEAALAFRGILSIHVREPTTTLWQSFKEEVREKMNAFPFYIKLDDSEQVEVYAGAIYDAIYLYANALNETLAAGGSKKDGRAIVQRMLNREFEGASGLVRMDSSGDREPDYSLKYYVNGSFQGIADYNYSTGGFNLRDVRVIWAGGRTTPPLDKPKCGWENELCVEQEKKAARFVNVVIGASTAGVVVLAFMFFIIIRKLRYETDLAENMTWKIKYEDLSIKGQEQQEAKPVGMLAIFNRATGSGPTGHSMTVSPSTTQQGQILRRSQANSSTQSQPDENTRQVYTVIGDYQGQPVAVERLRKRSVQLTRDVLIELKQVRDLSHENLNPFIGACIESPNILLVWSYCKKGSLQEVLANEENKIDHAFKLSMSIDIAAGMKYLHNSPVKFHGNLTSRHCMIDNHWVVSITDWGLNKFKAGQERIYTDTNKTNEDLLWTAPEHIDFNKGEKSGFSQKGDVYSYGIILQEISTRCKPFLDCNLDCKEIIQRVVAYEDPPFRPDLTRVDVRPEFVDLIVDCWCDDPEERPHFFRIVERLKKISGRGSNIIENMVSMMEKHANHLEQLVEERTRQLNEEKERTDKLLNRLLPPMVAEQLKIHDSVEAEEFEEVTMFFSDIVGFTKLASCSKPIEIVDFLNDLNVAFDEIITRFDVYKVETVGDAYVVVSGCPKLNGIKHAGEIASMALELLSHMFFFRLRHLPEHQLQLRIGIHTGPVVAGVVGITMPRFCLFGHTVHIASKMENFGLPLRIHVSRDCHSRLVELGGYYLSERGQVQIKRLGLVTTYWLVGKEGFDKPLPDPPLETSEPLFETLDVYYAS